MIDIEYETNTCNAGALEIPAFEPFLLSSLTNDKPFAFIQLNLHEHEKIALEEFHCSDRYYGYVFPTSPKYNETLKIPKFQKIFKEANCSNNTDVSSILEKLLTNLSAHVSTQCPEGVETELADIEINDKYDTSLVWHKDKSPNNFFRFSFTLGEPTKFTLSYDSLEQHCEKCYYHYKVIPSKKDILKEYSAQAPYQMAVWTNKAMHTTPTYPPDQFRLFMKYDVECA